MNAKLIIDGCEINVGIELLGNITNFLQDVSANQEMFHILAQSKSANLRVEVAYKDNISEETASLLLGDKDTTVLDRIVCNDMAKTIMNEEMLDNILQIANEETLKSIASNIGDYENVDTVSIANKLIIMDNPTVTFTVAENYSTPKKVLKSLLKNSDPDIANAAKSTLE